jgi:hypothetical protein
MSITKISDWGVRLLGGSIKEFPAVWKTTWRAMQDPASGSRCFAMRPRHGPYEGSIWRWPGREAPNMEAEDGATRYISSQMNPYFISLPRGTGRHSWAGGSAIAAPGRHGHEGDSCSWVCQSALVRNPTAIFNIPRFPTILHSPAAADRIHTLAWSGETRVCRLA